MQGIRFRFQITILLLPSKIPFVVCTPEAVRGLCVATHCALRLATPASLSATHQVLPVQDSVNGAFGRRLDHRVFLDQLVTNLSSTSSAVFAF